MSEKKLVTINSRKLDGKIHRSWQAELIDQQDSLLVFLGVFEFEVNHPDLGVIRRGTKSYEYYWLDRSYNIFRFHEPEGDLRNFYCNVNLPPKYVGDALDYVDLDVDILVWKDFSFEVLDLDEFEENAGKYNYSENLKQIVESNVKELIGLVENREFPFNQKI